MFIGISKPLAKIGGLHLGVGFRITKKNAAYMLTFLSLYYIFKFMLYVIVLCLWLAYAVYYGLFWCIKKLVIFVVECVRERIRARNREKQQ